MRPRQSPLVRLVLFAVGMLLLPTRSEQAEAVLIMFDYPGVTYSGQPFTLAHGISGNTIVGEYRDQFGRAHAFQDVNGTFSTINYPGSLRVCLQIDLRRIIRS